MHKTFVTDITHYLDQQGELVLAMPAPARRLASFLVLVIDAVTQEVPCEDRDTRIRCCSKNCTGSIRASLLSVNDKISWACPACGQQGVISNWQGTKWNSQATETV